MTTPKPKPAAKRDAELLKSSIKDVDDLFSSLNEKKKQQQKEKEKRKLDEASTTTARNHDKKKTKYDPVEEAYMKKSADADNNPKVHRWDAETGLPVYKFWELGIGEGKGDTKDCPFDCWCCR